MSNDETEYDLIVIGAEMTGNAAANKCASSGWRVAIVDELPYGGICALRGCDPKKILRRGAEIIDSARLLSGKGIDADGLHINWADLMKQKLGFTELVPANKERGLTSNGVDTLHGTANSPGLRAAHRRGNGEESPFTHLPKTRRRRPNPRRHNCASAWSHPSRSRASLAGGSIYWCGVNPPLFQACPTT